MKNIKIILLIAIMAAALATAGCGGNEETVKKPEPRLNTISLLLPYAEAETTSQNDIQQKLLTSFDAYAQEANLEVTHMFADGDAAKQAGQIAEASATETGAIVVIPVSGADLSEGLAAANEAGVPVVALHESVAGADTLSAVIVPDYKDAITKLAEAAGKEYPSDGICFINGPQGDVTADALAEYIGEVSGPEIKYSDWTFTGGRKTAAEYIDYAKTLSWGTGRTKPASFIAANASMASGVARAVSDAKPKDKIAVYALNPSGLNADLITSGKVTAAAVPDADAEAKQAIDLCAKLIANENVELNHLAPFLMLDKDNIEGYLSQPETAE
jgi:ABC-type sugar transport system substrate-binding protein